MVNMTGVRYSYPKSKPLFTALDFAVEPGGIVGLLGKNGAGKTTLLKLASGLLFAEAGEAMLFGVQAVRRVPEALARVAYVPEQFEVPSLRLREFIALHGGYYPRFSAARMEDYLQRFEVTGNERLSKLSFGQQKKVLVSFALATGAELVILDEPTNGLDIPSKQVFRRLVAEAADDSRAVVISTHQVRDVESLIDPVVVLDNGSVVFSASLAAITAGIAQRRFAGEADAHAAGALAMETRLGTTVALVPRAASAQAGSAGEADRATADIDVGVETDDIDLELLFDAAVRRSAELQAACGGAA